MKVLEHWIDIKRVISILYWRICYEAFQAGFNFASLLFAFAIYGASRVFRSHGPIERTAATAAQPAPGPQSRSPAAGGSSASHPTPDGGTADADAIVIGVG